MIRPMYAYEESACARVYAVCHPGFPARPLRWFEAHPTLVVEELVAGGEGVFPEVVGYCSYSVAIIPEFCSDGEAMLGYGIDVLPEHQGRGWGRKLSDARLNVARAVGAKVFMGHTSPDNHRMIRLFEADGLKPAGMRAAYPDGTPMIFYVGGVR